MPKAKLYPIVVDDFIPFCIFVVANNKENAKKIVEQTYTWLDDCANIEYLSPIDINEDTIFAIDVEMTIIKDSQELYRWICADEDGFYADGFKTKPGDIVDIEVENTEETKEDSNVADTTTEESETIESKYQWL
jgi:hypothetical protein